MTNRFSLAFRVYSVVGALTVLLCVFGYLSVKDELESKRLYDLTFTANQISDYFIEASRYGALERGLTSVGFSTQTGKLEELADDVRGHRAKMDEAFYKGQKLVQYMIELQPGNSDLKISLEKLMERRKILERAREQFDSYVRDGSDGMSSDRWIKIATALILAEKEVRMKVFAPVNAREKAMHANTVIKQSIWMASEYAGRIRALIGANIAKGVAMDVNHIDEVNRNYMVVQLNLKTVREWAEDSEVSSEVKPALEKMKIVFGRDFEKIRAKVFEEIKTGIYTITAKEWVGASTEGINSILGVAEAVSLEPAYLVKKARNESQQRASIFLGLVGLALMICFSTILYFKYKVMAPLNNYISRLSQVTTQVKDSSRGVASSSDSLASTAAEQAASIEETAASLEEFSSMVKNNVAQVEKTSELANSMKGAALKGEVNVREVVASMKEIKAGNEDIQHLVRVIGDIGEKTKMIDNIVFQTKILSFNASVEAERAGEYGRGFAVVAQEVSNLAEMSGKAAGEISRIVSESIRKAETVTEDNAARVERGDKIIQEMIHIFSEVTAKSENILKSAEHILSASRDQSAGVSQVNVAVAELDRATQQTAATAEETSLASSRLDGQAQDLGQIVVGLFRAIVGGGRDVNSSNGRVVASDSSNVIPMSSRESSGRGSGESREAMEKKTAKNAGQKAVGGEWEDLDDVSPKKPSASHSVKNKDDSWEKI